MGGATRVRLENARVIQIQDKKKINRRERCHRIVQAIIHRITLLDFRNKKDYDCISHLLLWI